MKKHRQNNGRQKTPAHGSLSRIFGLVAVECLLFSSTLQAATEIRQLTTSEKDNDIRSGSIIYASGSDTFLRIGQGTGQEFRGMVGFDIDSYGFTTNTTIIKAEVRLRIVGDPAPSDTTSFVSVYRMNADWVEGDTNSTFGTSATKGATWRYPDKSDTLTTWNTDGVLGGPEVEGTPSDTVDVATPSDGFAIPPATGFFFAWDVTADVQAFVDGTATNFGWLVTGDTGAGEALILFATRENTSAGVQPHLYIEFIPEPATALLMGAGALVLLAQRGFRRKGRTGL